MYMYVVMVPVCRGGWCGGICVYMYVVMVPVYRWEDDVVAFVCTCYVVMVPVCRGG